MIFMKYLLVCLMVLGLGCSAKSAEVKQAEPIVSAPAESVSTKTAVSVETIASDRQKGWAVTEEDAAYYASRILDGRVRIQPVLMVRAGEEAKARKLWESFAAAMPYQLNVITLEPQVFTIMASDVQKGEAFPDRLRLEPIRERLALTDAHTLPVVYWLNDQIGTGSAFDESTGIYVRNHLNAINDREIAFLQWLAVVHE